MPLLSRRKTEAALTSRPPLQETWPVPAHLPEPPPSPPGSGFRPRLLEPCGNPRCATGWLHLWRSRSAPVFEGKWNCSAECTAERIRAAIQREFDGRAPAPERHSHRIPIGLLMLEQGWITGEQLRCALESQRTHGAGRLGHWLMVKEGVREDLVTRALGLQWSCPVLSPQGHDPEALGYLLPRFFVDAFGALPLRVAAGKVAYVGFEDRLDPVLALALERMSGMRVEIGIVAGSQFGPAHARMLEASYPEAELVEAASEPALVRALARRIEQVRPVDARLVRVHDCLWLRMWRKPQTGALPNPRILTDILCTVNPS